MSSIFIDAYVAKQQAEWDKVKKFVASPEIFVDVPSWEYDEEHQVATYTYREGLAVISCYFSAKTGSPRFYVVWLQDTSEQTYKSFDNWKKLKEWVGCMEAIYNKANNG